MKKKNLFYASLMALGMTFAFTSCGDDNNTSAAGGGEGGGSAATEEEVAQNLDYSAGLSKQWGNYAYNVAMLLQEDANSLYDAWNTSYEGGDAFADQFKNHSSSSGYTSAKNCVEEIFAGCRTIASEVGTAKIGEPVDYWTQGQTNKALYAVESWYSWHSRDDYKNNILSIANSFLGTRLDNSSLSESMSSQAQANSLYAVCSANGALSAQTATVWKNICAAWKAIDDIPQPFRNNIGSTEAKTAMDACAKLEQSLAVLQAQVQDNLGEQECQNIVNQYVDKVVLPTYSELKTKVTTLLDKVSAFQKSPSNAAFEAMATAWLDAREPWESSEAFLFGPVSKLGLDPNMDSWPLDVVGIYNLLKTQKWSDMQWTGNYDEEDTAIEAAQSVRGFHTLEYLIFKNGEARKVE